VPRPREERVREGKTRNLPEPVLVSGRPELADVLTPPAHLTADAGTWWGEVVPALAEAGVIDRIDVSVLSMAAKAWGDVIACDRVMAEKGMFAIGSVGNVVIAPWMKLRRDSMLTFERYVNHLALSPVARTRLGLASLHARAMVADLERALEPDSDVDADVFDAEVIEDAEVGVPGL
jgi:P27 family predicted phage terminase small subunit